MICEVIDVPQNNPCQMCNPCIRMRLMELGIITGSIIDIQEKMDGMFILNVISDNGSIEQSFGVRKDELERICYKLK